MGYVFDPKIEPQLTHHHVVAIFDFHFLETLRAVLRQGGERDTLEPSSIKAVITGGAGGIGAAIADQICHLGGQVSVIDNSTERLEQLEQRFVTRNDKCSVIIQHADVTDAQGMASAIKDSAEQMGGINVVICAAAILIDGVIVGLGPGGVRRYSHEDWQRQLDVNLTGSFVTAQIAAEMMILARTSGCIVLFSSISRHGRPGQSCYGATKAALASLAVSLARDLAPYGIRALAISPGLTETEMAMSIPDARRKDLLETVLARRMGTPEEIARMTVEAVVNDYVNGTVIDVHGGYCGG